MNNIYDLERRIANAKREIELIIHDTDEENEERNLKTLYFWETHLLKLLSAREEIK